MNALKISDISKLAEWFGNFENIDKDNMISAYINEMKDCIVDLQLMVDNYNPDDKEREMLNHSSRLMASVLNDLKGLRSQVKAAAIISAAGIDLKKGGAA